MKNTNIKSIKYQIYCNEDFADRRLALTLFDMLEFKENIVLYAFRAYSDNDKILKSFAEKIECKIIKDLTRNDSFCIFIPKLVSNLQLFELMTNNDTQTEWTYIPLISNLEKILYNRDNIKRYGAVSCGVSAFEAFLDADCELYFQFDIRFIEINMIEKGINEWEKTFKDINFKKIIK